MTIPCQAPMWEGVTTIGLSPSTLPIDTAMEVRTNSKNPALFVAFNVFLLYNKTKPKEVQHDRMEKNCRIRKLFGQQYW